MAGPGTGKHQTKAAPLQRLLGEHTHRLMEAICHQRSSELLRLSLGSGDALQDSVSIRISACMLCLCCDDTSQSHGLRHQCLQRMHLVSCRTQSHAAFNWMPLLAPGMARAMTRQARQLWRKYAPQKLHVKGRLPWRDCVSQVSRKPLAKCRAGQS